MWKCLCLCNGQKANNTPSILPKGTIIIGFNNVPVRQHGLLFNHYITHLAHHLDLQHLVDYLSKVCTVSRVQK